MTAADPVTATRTGDFFSHIDMGFLNRRLAVSALGSVRRDFLERQTPGEDHMTVLRNDHLLVTMLIDVCEHLDAPTLSEAMASGSPRQLFMSIECLSACRDVYSEERVSHEVVFDFETTKTVQMAYHTEHLVSSTERLTLGEGRDAGHREAIIGLLHDKGDYWEVEPIVIGSPMLDHPRNTAADRTELMFGAYDYGELLPEDIEQFSDLLKVVPSDADEWMSVMRELPEEKVKAAFAELLSEPTKKDWGGEENDHFSANVVVAGRRCTAAFLLKGPAKFQEMTPAMCGKNGDQIYRLVGSGADLSIVQHAHLVGSAVRETVRRMVVTPGRSRKFVVIDGQATYRILKAYGYV